MNIKTITENLLSKMGTPCSLKGFDYIVEAVEYMNEHPNTKICGELYPTLAEKFETTPIRVERCIRVAINNTFRNGNVELLNEVFTYSLTTPTNKLFLNCVMRRVKRMMEAEQC